jgi:hypothetical protein
MALRTPEIVALATVFCPRLVQALSVDAAPFAMDPHRLMVAFQVAIDTEISRSP